jgi:formate dehydrogenase major subunit
MMTRRQFTSTTAAALTTAFGFSLSSAQAAVRELKISRTTQSRSVCPYCAVGCSVVVHTLGDGARNVRGSVVHIEGDPDSPINRGTLCPKGISLKQFVNSDRRLTRPLYRPAGASEWQPISWEEATTKMARLIKASRDKGFVEKDAAGHTVNHVDNMVMIGGCTDANEVNYLISKFRFGLGLLNYENQSRL